MKVIVNWSELVFKDASKNPMHYDTFKAGDSLPVGITRRNVGTPEIHLIADDGLTPVTVSGIDSRGYVQHRDLIKQALAVLS